MCLQLAYGRHQIQPRTHRSLGVVFVGLGVTEVDEHAIAHVLCNKAAETLHGFRDALLVGGDNLS